MGENMIEFDEKPAQIGTNIKVLGVGGSGGNAVNTMIRNGLTGVEFVAANTDSSDIAKSKAKITLQLGKKLTRGLGTGANPDLGSRAAEESKDEIKSHLDGADMCFITAGMGGGTGTGGAPIIAKIAREMGILTVGIVTTPFEFEGKKRKDNASEGITNLKEYVDTLILIPNQKLCDIYPEMSVANGFMYADNVLFEAVKAVSDIINVTGYINVDFADVKAVMQNMGYALMGTGTAEGDNRSVNAAKAAINNPLLADIDLAGCQSMLINITAGNDMKMSEFQEISNVVINETGTAANIITGLIFDEAMEGKISVTIIATGLKNSMTDHILEVTPPSWATPEPVKEPFRETNRETSHKDDDRNPPPPPVLPNNPEDDGDIESIFERLKITPRQNLAPQERSKEENTRLSTLRTDIPAFLRALD